VAAEKKPAARKKKVAPPPGPPVWTTACLDWEQRIVERRSLIPFEPLFPAEAEAGLATMDEFIVVDVLGSPAFGEISRDWVRGFCASVFGALDPESGRRLIKEWFLLISKKNTKSTTAGLLMLAILVLNWRQAGEFGILAPTVEVANNAFKPAADAIRADDELLALFHVQDHIRTITHKVTKATLQVVAADAEAVAGKKWIVTLVDELWLFGKNPKAEDMFREATGGLASRPEGCVLWLSTQSNEPPAGVFKQKLDYARDVRDGKIVDPQFCPVLYEFPRAMLEAGAHRRPENFYVTNPNMGSSVDEAFLVREMAKAEKIDEGSVRGFMAKHLNVEIGLNLRSDRWPGAEFWDAPRNIDRALTFEALLERSEVVVCGGDGGGLDDLLGFAALGREKVTRRWLLWTHAWAHRIVLDRRKSIAAELKDFEAEGSLTIVEEPGQDVEAVADLVCRIRDAGLLPEKNAFGVDSAGIGDIVDELLSPARGLLPEQIVAISQGWRLTGAIKTTERKLAAGAVPKDEPGEIVHNGSKLMNKCASNAKVDARGLVTKAISGTAKIDPLMATFDAVSLMALTPEATAGKSFWETAAA
jgi:phage terminase large subunit-like protein